MGGYRITLFFIIAVMIGCSYNCQCQKHPVDNNTQDKLVHLSKLSPELLQLYERGNGNTVISVLGKTSGEMTSAQKKELITQGISIGTVTDDVFTADLKLKYLSFLTEKPYIIFVELSRKLKLLKKE
ncbi:MAG: hypothetical protein M1381_07405 [Deltaproteobacteria bacterium]|nr:hypothetical protein [Deltaproteobacteria bacterium]